jgi:hypothetical protein
MAIRQGYAEIASPKREDHNHNLKYNITMKNYQQKNSIKKEFVTITVTA